MSMHRVPAPPLPIDALRATLGGRMILPGDADYDAARTVAAGGIDRHPALIVRVADDRDVARVVALARETGLELAVRSGGHSGLGHGVTEGGIVIDLTAMKAIEIDVAGRTAWAETGLTAGEVTRAAGEHGLAVGFGDTASVGIGGITLGGGIGFLVRKHGLTVDSVLAADVVTADGECLRVDAGHHPDLFWAIRGGGGNFGVVTRFRFQLHPVPAIVGGMLFLPATPEVVAGFVAAAHAAPEELSTIANVMPAPPMPFLPEEAHGSLVLMAFLAYAGDADEGQRAMAPFRALASPLADLVRPMTYPEMYPPEPPAEGGPPIAIGRTLFTDAFDLDAAREVVARLQASDAPFRAAQLRVLGGAMARVPADATAFAHRDRRIMVVVVSFSDGSAEDRARRQAWADDLADALRQGEAGAYVNFISDEDPARVREAYPDATWRRLVEVKRSYDPGNLFHLNGNIPPG